MMASSLHKTYDQQDHKIAVVRKSKRREEYERRNLFRGSGNFSSDEAKELARLKKKTEILKMLLKY